MNTPLSWIKAYVPELECTDQEYRDAMTLTGTKVENVERLDKNLDKIVIGQVLKVERHPDAEKLVICQVNVGTEVIQIVTGAPNVFEGAKVPVVLVGGTVAGGHDGSKAPDGIKIKKGKLRGVESFGMMCSIEELGSSRDFYPDAPENGLYILKEDAPIGEDAVAYLGLRDSVFEYEITSNRVDCYSVLGIAREAAATFAKPFVPPVVTETGNDDDVNKYISVEIQAPELCSRYCARVVRNVKIGPSPEWMQRRLSAMGIRPINNLVDITNYVMEEYGQPMHAYDLNTIADRKIVVRRASNGEKFVTLDGQERTLDENILMICDGEKAVGIAGIMGGENSMITDSVTDMLFEAACFDGTNIRLSSKRLGHRTDASGIFEKGLDPNNAIDAMNRACQLIEELGAGEVVGGVVDVYPVKKEERQIAFDLDKVNKLIGIDATMDMVKDYFNRLELRLDEATNMVTIPTFRQDLECIADLAEEVTRFYGYDKIPTTLPHGESTTGKLSFKLRIEALARDVAEMCGFSEAMTYSFESPKVFKKLLIPEDDILRSVVTIANPLGEDYSIMRTTPLNGILTSLSTNYNRRNKDVRLYELANTYLPHALPLTELPDERKQFVLGAYGNIDFFGMKGVVEEFLYQAGLREKMVCDPSHKKPYLHPGRQAELLYNGEVIGYMGELHPEVQDNYDIGERVMIAVLDLPTVIPYAGFDYKYEGLAKFPAVSRDISMVMPKSIMVGQVEEIIEKKGGKILESYHLFDIYEGVQIKAGFMSVAYSITFRSKDHTLEDKEVQTVMDKILKELSALGIELRS